MAAERLRRASRNIERNTEMAAVKDPLTGEQMALGEHEKTQEQIWQDPEEQARFLRYLGTKDKRKSRPIIESLSSNKLLTENQQEFVDASIKEYNQRAAEMGRLDTVFTTEYVRNIADTDKTIGLMIKQVGLEKVHELLRKQLEMLSFEDEKRYDKIVRSMAAERAVSESGWAKHVDGQVAAALHTTGIPDEELGSYVAKSLKLTSGFDSAEKAKIADAAKSNMGKLMRIANFVSNGALARGRAEQLVDAFQRQRDLLQRSNVHLHDVAKVLKATITPEMRLEMQRVMIEGGELKEVPETTVKTLGDYKEAKEFHSEAMRKERFKKHVKAELKKLGKTPGGVSDAEKNAIKDSFVDNEYGAQQKRTARGLLATLLAIFFKNKVALRAETNTIWP